MQCAFVFIRSPNIYGLKMSKVIRLSDLLVEEAGQYAEAIHRSTSEQIEYWARLGKAAEENPDLPINLLKQIIASSQEVDVGNILEYKFG